MSSPRRRELGGRGARRASLPAGVEEELAAAIGKAAAGRATQRLGEAAAAFESERFRDAVALLGPLSRRVPGAPTVRELHGLALYRSGRWRVAIRELEAFETLSGSLDQHPVRADCHRALGQYAEVERLWDEVRRGGVSAAVMVEGRIVMAGSLADRERVVDAVELLEKGPVQVRRPRPHHLRLWYALASLYERAGDVTRARHLFGRIVAAEPSNGDAASRHAALK